MRIGLAALFTDSEGEICTRPLDDKIYEVHSDGIDRDLGVYTSVWHWVISVSQEARAVPATDQRA